MIAVRPLMTGSPTSLSFIGGAAQVGAPAWDALARDGFHAYRWFETVENAGWQARHLAAWQGGELAGVLPAYLVTGRETSGDLHDRWLGALSPWAARIGVTIRPTLSVTLPLAMSSAPLGDFALESAADANRILDALETRAREDRAKAVVWPYLDGGCTAVREAARRRGYVEIHGDTSAELAMEWDSFETYLASRSKSVRRTIRADLWALERDGFRVESATDFRHASAAMDGLYREAYRRRNGVDVRLMPAFFDRLAATPDPAIWAQLTWQGDRLVGSSINLAAGGRLDGTLAAFAAEVQGGPVYYNDLLYAPLATACRLGASRINLGATALHAKVLRGARLRRRVSLVRGLTPAVHLLLRGLGRVIDARNQEKERRAIAGLHAADAAAFDVERRAPSGPCVWA